MSNHSPVPLSPSPSLPLQIPELPSSKITGNRDFLVTFDSGPPHVNLVIHKPPPFFSSSSYPASTWYRYRYPSLVVPSLADNIWALSLFLPSGIFPFILLQPIPWSLALGPQFSISACFLCCVLLLLFLLGIGV